MENKFCEYFFTEDDVCLKWICKCGHKLGSHSTRLTGKTSKCIECEEHLEEVESFGECSIECLFKIKLKENENDK